MIHGRLLFNFILAVLSSTLLQGQVSHLMPLPQRALVHHAAYSLDYNEEQEQSYWVFYELTREELGGAYTRSNNFRADPLVTTGSAGADDYKYSGYDRGHLAPAADMTFSSQAMLESFYMSNMSPQDPSFNRGIWKQLEEQVRAWAYDDGSLYVVSGPLFLEGSGRLPSGVGIPSHFYKIVLDWDGKEVRSIAFLFPNAKGSGGLSAYEVSIDRLEVLSGLDFFSVLDDAIEAEVEARKTGFWDYSLRYVAPSNSSAEAPATQCQGITQKGLRCKRRTKNENEYCWQHQSQVGMGSTAAPKVDPAKRSSAVQCSGTTKRGTRCKRRTKNGNGRCWQHQ